MRRREFIGALGGAAVSWPLGARAQQASNIYRVGVLEITSETLNAANFDALRQGLRELGYFEGQNLIIDYRSADGRGERFPDLAAELLRLKVDVIVTRGTPAVLAAKRATASVPVVMAAAGDPLMVVASLARPGDNVTGLSGFTKDLEGKRVELIKELVPGIARIAYLGNMNNPITANQWKEVTSAAQVLALQSQLLDVRKSADIPPAFDAARSERAEALLIENDAATLGNPEQIAALAAQHRLPAIYAARAFIEAGGLIAYGPSYPDLYRRAATYVDKILKGANPGDLPIQQPTRFELIINLKTAKALGISIPQAILVRADEVIE